MLIEGLREEGHSDTVQSQELDAASTSVENAKKPGDDPKEAADDHDRRLAA